MAEKEQYLVGMLKLAIKKSGDPSLKLEPAGEVMTEAKTMAELEAGNVGVMWGIATKDMEARFKPIRIPLVKGLLGYRLFIIKQGEQYKFDGIKTFQDLTRLTAGQGRTWGDTQILANAGIPLATSIKSQIFI